MLDPDERRHADEGGAGRQACSTAQELCAGGWQTDTQPARIGQAGADARSQDRAQAIENLRVDLFVAAYARPPRQIILDLDATDDPPHWPDTDLIKY